MPKISKATHPTMLSCLLRTGALSVASCLTFAAPASAATVFDGFEGTWRGRGTVSLTDGSREAIRCRAVYGLRGDGNALSVDVNCASDSYRVHIVANAVAQGSALSGSWQETTRQIGGTLTGRVPAYGEMQASFETTGGGLQLGAHTDGRRQAITIEAQGSDIRSVDISLKR